MGLFGKKKKDKDIGSGAGIGTGAGAGVGGDDFIAKMEAMSKIMEQSAECPKCGKDIVQIDGINLAASKIGKMDAGIVMCAGCDSLYTISNVMGTFRIIDDVTDKY